MFSVIMDENITSFYKVCLQPQFSFKLFSAIKQNIMEEHNPAATQINNFARRDIFRKTLFIHANREGENKNVLLAK